MCKLGLAFAHGLYATSEETARKPPDDRSVSLWNVEGEWSFGYTKVSGEVTRDRLQTIAGTETAYGWFVQGQQTLTPRFFVAARQEGASAPPLRTAAAVGPRHADACDRSDLGYRLNTGHHLPGQLPEPQALHEAGLGSAGGRLRRLGAPLVVAAFFISGHGFGHATRDIEVIRALARQRPALRVVVRTSAPAWLFDGLENVTVKPTVTDTGVVQFDSLRIDVRANCRATRPVFYAEFDRRVAEEAAAS